MDFFHTPTAGQGFADAGHFRRAGGRWQTLLPVVSAAIVTVLGLGIMLKGLLPYLAG